MYLIISYYWFQYYIAYCILVSLEVLGQKIRVEYKVTLIRLRQNTLTRTRTFEHFFG